MMQKAYRLPTCGGLQKEYGSLWLIMLVIGLFLYMAA